MDVISGVYPGSGGCLRAGRRDAKQLRWIGIQLVFGLLALFESPTALAAVPQLYFRPAQESPVRGAPDDLLLLAGYGFAVDDTVVYGIVPHGNESPIAPKLLPTRATADIGVAPVVSAADVPYSLTVRLPRIMRANQTYALWVRTAHGKWSRAVKINDVRPLWATPALVYASKSLAGLPRELKIVGRNLQPGSGHRTLVRLVGPQRFESGAISDAQSPKTIDEYVARVALPADLMPGQYRIQVNRDGVSWVTLDGQVLDVLPDPPALAEFSVADPRFGGCRPDDGADDAGCIVRAIDAAARAGGGTVYFGPGTWDLIDSAERGVDPTEGIVVPRQVQLRGAGIASTRVERHAEWNAHGATAAFTLVGRTLVTGFTFRDLQRYKPDDQSGPFLQLGENWRRVVSGVGTSDATVSDVIITHNVFDKPKIAIGVGGLPIERLFLTYNIFGAYWSALELSGDPYNVVQKYRLDDSVVDYNVFKPGSDLDLLHKSGALASEVGAGYRVDFSGNTADGASTDYLYAPEDPRGWRAAFFWSPNNNIEEMLVSQNVITCAGDKIGDGEAIAFDNNLNSFGFSILPTAVDATTNSVTVSEPLAAQQHDHSVPVAQYYVGQWMQVVSGPGLGQVRKIASYSTDALTHRTTIRVVPDWDVVPIPAKSRFSIGREYWQVYTVDNTVNNRQPTCQKSNRSRRAGGLIVMWAQSSDSVIAGNHQSDSDGIHVQEEFGFVHRNFEVMEHPCADCTVLGFFNYFLDIRDNVIDGEYDWGNDCSSSGIEIGIAAAPWGEGAPPTVGFGVSVSHNTIRHADGLFGGAISQMNTWWAGPEPRRWPLSDNLLIHHNSISDVDGPRALAICGASRPRMGIAFPDPAIAWRSVLYANSCKNVSTGIGGVGVDATAVCPSSVTDSCECASPAK